MTYRRTSARLDGGVLAGASTNNDTKAGTRTLIGRNVLDGSAAIMPEAPSAAPNARGVTLLPCVPSMRWQSGL